MWDTLCKGERVREEGVRWGGAAVVECGNVIDVMRRV